jgi:hypothetical protein
VDCADDFRVVRARRCAVYRLDRQGVFVDGVAQFCREAEERRLELIAQSAAFWLASHYVVREVDEYSHRSVFCFQRRYIASSVEEDERLIRVRESHCQSSRNRRLEGRSRVEER